MADLIGRQEAIDALARAAREKFNLSDEFNHYLAGLMDGENAIRQLPSAQPEPKWIPCSERLPEDTRPVNITWVNREPEPYYAGIKDVPFTATGHYCKEKWYWYSATCQDYLDEYGECEVDAADNMIEIIAWMPLPAPYKGGETE